MLGLCIVYWFVYSGMGSEVIVIPARFASSRFPGKPLALLCGRPLVWWVWDVCCRVVGVDCVFVATDDVRIRDVVVGFGGRVVMTSGCHLTGCDRVAEVVGGLGFVPDVVLNVQGDEPLVSVEDVRKVLVAQRLEPGLIHCGVCKIDCEADFRSLSVPKVVFGGGGRLLYVSRSPVPCGKGGGFVFGWRQVCIYGFGAGVLCGVFGLGRVRSVLESVEDVELLRVLECGFGVGVVEVGRSVAVDFPEDLVRVEGILGGL